VSLPAGFAVRLARTTRVLDGGRSLLGGAPTRLIHLSEKALPLFDGSLLRVRDAATAALADRLLQLGMAVPAVELLPEATEACTVVVPIRDRPEMLDRLLGSIGGRHPVIVVDDASHRPEAVAAVAARHGAELLALRRNAGPAGARNAGLARVRTPLVAFVDSDVVLPADTLPVLLRHFHDPGLALVAPRITALPPSGPQSWIARYEAARSSLDLGPDPAMVVPRTPVAWLPMACAVARVEALGAGFDATMRVGEDVDLCWRLAEEGRRVRYEPSVEAPHEHRVRVGSWLARKAFYGSGATPLAKRHPRAIVPAILAPWSVLLLLGLLVQRPWSYLAAGAAAGATASRIAGKLGRTRHPVRQAVRLTGSGALSALTQGSALLLRHWWPLALLGCLVSRRMRRAVVAVAVVDALVEWERTGARLDPLRFGVARRLDDLAYGAGVWWSALRGRSLAALRPDLATEGDRPS